MKTSIRNAVPADLGLVLDLNELVVPNVNSLTLDRMRWFHDHAHRFRVAERDGRVSGFLIGFFEGSAYESDNYRWFASRYDRFAYVDRVAVSPEARRFGIASMLYDDLLDGLPGDVPALTCEVNLRPPNPGSLAFHERFGFEEVGRQETEGGAKEVLLLARKLRPQGTAEPT